MTSTINYSNYHISSAQAAKNKRHKETARRKAMMRFRIAIMTAVILTTIIASSITYFVVYNSATEMVVTDTEIVFVEEGDTLWGIAKEYTPEGMDIRKYIDIVCEYNGMGDSILMPGDMVEIPILERYNPLDK